MTRKTTQPPPDVPLYLALPREEASRKLTERMDGGAELRHRPISNAQALKDVQRAYWTWSEYNEEMLRRMFTSSKIAEEYSSSFGFFSVESGL